MSLARMRKALVAVVGLAAIVATELPPGSPEGLQRWAPVVIGAATALGVYGVRNKQPTPASTPTVDVTVSPGTDPKAVAEAIRSELKKTAGAGPPTSRVGQVYDQTKQPLTR